MASFWTGLLSKTAEAFVGVCHYGMLVLDDQSDTGCTAPGDATNGLWVNTKASALPTGGATSANQATQITAEGEINGHVHSIDGKVTACNTGAVTVAASALPSGAATETSVAAAAAGIGTAADAKVDTDAAGTLSSKLRGLVSRTVELLGISGTSRTATAPNLTTAAARAIEVARDGSARVNADVYDFLHQRHIVASTAAQQVACVRTPPTFAFDGLWVDTENCVVYGQPRGRPYQIVDGLTFTDAAKWTTAGTDWTIAGAKATHVPGAGTDDLVGTMGAMPLIVGKTYLVYVKGTKTAGTSLTAYCGTAAGTAIAANGAFEFVQALVCTGSSSCLLRATADFEGEVTAYQIYTHTPKLPANCYSPFALTEVLGVAAGTALTTLIVATAADVYGIYRRVPGVADLG